MLKIMQGRHRGPSSSQTFKSIAFEWLGWRPVCWWPMHLGPWPLKAAAGTRVVHVFVWLGFYVSIFREVPNTGASA